jgi:DNA-binding NarL/FixJ family response regulator
MAAPVRILLIEDDNGHARLIQELLKEAEGFAFVLERSARLSEGVRLAASASWSIVLLDLSLPDGFGRDTYHQLATAAPGMPVLVLSSNDDQSVAEELLGAGARGYLVKGKFDGGMLAAAIQRIVTPLSARSE